MNMPGTMLSIGEGDSLSNFDRVEARTRWYTAVYKKTSIHKGVWWYMVEDVKTLPNGDNGDYPDVEVYCGIDNDNTRK